MPNLHPKALKRNLIKKWKLVRGDLVQVISGADKGKQGVLKKVIRKENRVLVEGVNMVNRRVKKTKENAGYVLQHEAPIHYSNVSLVDPQTGEPTKTKYMFTEEGDKVRISKKTGAIIPKPKHEKKTKPSNPYKDTMSDPLIRKTYHESELIELKNQYLKVLEMNHFNKLRVQYEKRFQQQTVRDMKDKLFKRDVLHRAKELYGEQKQ